MLRVGGDRVVSSFVDLNEEVSTRGVTFGGPVAIFVPPELTLAPHGVQSSKKSRITGPTWAQKVPRRLPGDPLGTHVGSDGREFGDIFELRSRIVDFPKSTVLLWRGHDFQGCGGLENRNFRRPEASKKASDETWALEKNKNVKNTILPSK